MNEVSRPELRILRVFLSSPGDVAAERKAVLRAIDELNREPGLSDRAPFRSVAWDVPGAGPLVATLAPQEAVNRSLPLPSQCDLVVVIFGERMGSPLAQPRRPTGEPYLSGTEFEYWEGLDGHRRAGRPEVIVYRRFPLPPLAADEPDHAKKSANRKILEQFFTGFFNPDGSWARGYTPYADPAEFEQRIVADLKRMAWTILEQRGQTPTPSPRHSAPLTAPVDAPGVAGVLQVWKEFPSLTSAERRRNCQQTLSWIEERLLTPVFRVAILGRWRQGKSLLINRLVGGAALPENLTRALAVRTVVGWGQGPAARLSFSAAALSDPLDEWPEDVVRHRDAAGAGPVPSFDLPHDRLREIPQPDPNQADVVVEQLDVFWPAELLRDGVELLDTPGTNVAHLTDGWRDALDRADLVIAVADGSSAGLIPQDLTLLTREVRGRGHERFAVALTWMDNLGRAAPGQNPTAIRDRTTALAGLPGDWVFPLGLQKMTSDTRAELDLLAMLISRAAAERWVVKARSALLRLRTEAAAAFGPQPTRPQQDFAGKLARLIQDLPPSP